MSKLTSKASSTDFQYKDGFCQVETIHFCGNPNANPHPDTKARLRLCQGLREGHIVHLLCFVSSVYEKVLEKTDQAK